MRAKSGVMVGPLLALTKSGGCFGASSGMTSFTMMVTTAGGMTASPGSVRACFARSTSANGLRYASRKTGRAFFTKPPKIHRCACARFSGDHCATFPRRTSRCPPLVSCAAIVANPISITGIAGAGSVSDPFFVAVASSASAALATSAGWLLTLMGDDYAAEPARLVVGAQEAVDEHVAVRPALAARPIPRRRAVLVQLFDESQQRGHVLAVRTSEDPRVAGRCGETRAHDARVDRLSHALLFAIATR